MNLEAAKEELKRRIDGLQDEQAVQDLLLQVEFLLDPLPPEVPVLTVEDLRRRAEEADEDIRAGRTYPIEEVMADLHRRFGHAD